MIKILFVRGCIIQANKTDDQNDILSKSDIKKINLNLENAKFDIQHNKEPVDGCRIIENTITDYSTIIADTVINPGSWTMTIKIDNPYLENFIENGEIQPDGRLLTLNGFSLFSFANGAETYADVNDKSEIYPIYVSFVEDPSNKIPFEIFEPQQYISKSTSDNMANDNEKSFLEKLKALIASEESTETAPAPTDAPADETEIKKEANTKTDEQKTSAPPATPAPANPAPADNKPAPAPATNAAPQKPAPSTQPPKDGEVAKACGGSDNKDISKAADPAPSVPAGTKMETQTGQPTDAPTVEPLTKDDIPAIVAAVCEAMGCNEEDDEPVDNGESEDKKYIVKQATSKEDTLVAPEPKRESIFDIYGVKK